MGGTPKAGRHPRLRGATTARLATRGGMEHVSRHAGGHQQKHTSPQSSAIEVTSSSAQAMAVLLRWRYHNRPSPICADILLSRRCLAKMGNNQPSLPIIGRIRADVERHRAEFGKHRGKLVDFGQQKLDEVLPNGPRSLQKRSRCGKQIGRNRLKFGRYRSIVAEPGHNSAEIGKRLTKTAQTWSNPYQMRPKSGKCGHIWARTFGPNSVEIKCIRPQNRRHRDVVGRDRQTRPKSAQAG